MLESQIDVLDSALLLVYIHKSLEDPDADWGLGKGKSYPLFYPRREAVNSTAGTGGCAPDTQEKLGSVKRAGAGHRRSPQRKLRARRGSTWANSKCQGEEAETSQLNTEAN
ncbi:hypothetical protein H1C71_025787 [Ictidomys tridecemlineatus]|nr:hypothetical protein H1C71_025787 [Ictidomys tridecemlineatus]